MGWSDGICNHWSRDDYSRIGTPLMTDRQTAMWKALGESDCIDWFGGVMVTHPELPCSGYGRRPQEAIEEFCERFELQWKALVGCSPEDLTLDAQITSERFQS